jgi:hypothetical protein
MNAIDRVSSEDADANGNVDDEALVVNAAEDREVLRGAYDGGESATLGG